MSNKNYLNPARYVRSKCAIFCLPINARNAIAFSNYNGLKFLQCACKFTENSTHNEGLSKRKEIKALIEDIKKVNPNVDDNIFRSIHNVNMATIPGWRDRDSGTLHSFTENY